MTSAFLHLPLAIFGLGTPELIAILAIILLLFGGAKLPSLARGLGNSIKEFKKASKGEEEEPVVKPGVAAEPQKKIEPSQTHGSN